MSELPKLRDALLVNIKYGGDYDVYIGRPSDWSNPFRIGKDGTRQQVIERYREYLNQRPELTDRIKIELRSKRLGCYCYPLPCHGDVLLEIANA